MRNEIGIMVAALVFFIGCSTQPPANGEPDKAMLQRWTDRETTGGTTVKELVGVGACASDKNKWNPEHGVARSGAVAPPVNARPLTLGWE